jgi:hypothetical protein
LSFRAFQRNVPLDGTAPVLHQVGIRYIPYR